MWTKEGYQPQRQQAPVDDGVSLGVWSRNRGNDQLRAGLKEYEGHKYIGLRLWSRGNDGQFWPTPKGLTIRLAEAESVAAAILKGLGSEADPDPPAGPSDDDPSRPQYVDRSRRRPQTRPPADLPAASPPSREFNEFQE